MPRSVKESRERGGAASRATTAAATAERVRRAAHLEDALRSAVLARVKGRWSGVIPPTEGGRLFREIADDLGVIEERVSNAARAAGVWPWLPDDVAAAMQDPEWDAASALGRHEGKRRVQSSGARPGGHG